MSLTRTHIVVPAVFALLFLFSLTQNVYAGGKNSASTDPNALNSELVVRRVDSNQLVRLKIYLDGKSKGSLRVGQTAIYKVKNGYHTVRVGFDDYQRGTEIAQFTANHSSHIFSVTDTSIVLVSEDSFGDYAFSEDVGGGVIGPSMAPPPKANSIDSSIVIDNSVRTAFDKATKAVTGKRRIAIVNVDGDNIHEANFILEELTHLSVNSPKKFYVIDRRVFDAYRTQNSIGMPSYENDFMLRYLGHLVKADYVISARIDGPGDLRRLRVKTLKVEDGALVGDASERL